MEQELKQRLIGVTVIVALVVIFVPMLFDQSGDPAKGKLEGVPALPDHIVEKTLELPKTADDLAPKETEAAPESGYRIVPLNEEPESKPEGAASAKPQESPLVSDKGGVPVEEEEFVAEPESAVEPEKPASPIKPSKLAEVPPKSGIEPKVTPVAEAKKSKPSAASPAQPPHVESSKSSESARSQPSKPVSQSAAANPEGGKPIVPKKPAASSPPTKSASADTIAKLSPGSKSAAPPIPKPVTEPGSVPQAWVVQTGSFTTEAKARALAEKLRQSKFPAFVETASGEAGTFFRVQVGPELDRGRAEQVQKQIESGMGIRGFIVPHR